MAEVEIPHPDHVKEHAANPFTRRVALAVAVYAVGLAVASFGGHNTAKEMMMAKQEEANRWNQFQAKSTREALYNCEVIKLEADKAAAGADWPPAREKLLDKFRTMAARMDADKKDIMDGVKDEHRKGAKDYQDEVKLFQKKDPYFEFAEVIFQVAIVLASVAMLSEKRWAFAGSLGLAVLGIVLTANGFALLDGGGLLGGHH